MQKSGFSGMRPGFLKCCFHAHTREENPYAPSELIEYAKLHGYDVLAVTEHDEIYFTDEMRREAEKHDLLLLPGIEASVGEGAHVLLVNTTSFPSCRMDMQDIRSWLYGEADREKVLVIAPHPFYPRKICLREQLIEYIDIFDAIEFSYFRFRFLDGPNRKAVGVAKQYDKPVVGTGDVHRLWHLEPTYSMLRGAKEPDAVVQAVKRSGFNDCCIENNSNSHLPADKTIVVKTRYLGLGEFAKVLKMGLFEGDDPIINLRA